MAVGLTRWRILVLFCALWAISGPIRAAACEDCTVTNAVGPEDSGLPCECACACGCANTVRLATSSASVRSDRAATTAPIYPQPEIIQRSTVLDLNPRPPRA